MSVLGFSALAASYNKTLNRTAKASLLFPPLRSGCPVSLALELIGGYRDD